jgi:hypothetical protein
MTPSQEEGGGPDPELQFRRLPGDKRLGVAARVAWGRAERIVWTFASIHPLAAHGPEFSLVQVSDVAIGRDVFQISKRRAVRRCGSNFEHYDGRARNFYIRSQWSAGIDEEFAVFAGAVRIEEVEV